MATPTVRSIAGRLASSGASIELALIALVILPIVSAVVHAVDIDWYPIGDDAYFSLRSRDVLTTHHPWLGTWTSAAQTKGINFNNPGPLFFDILAIPSKISPQLGPVFGTAALAAASAAGSVVVARRVAGWPGALTAALGALLLMWSMGTSVLVEPWQPHSLLLPFVFFATCAWAMAAGRAWAAVGAIAAGSLLLQSHLGYVILVPALLGAASVQLLLRSRRSESTPAHGGRWLVIAVLVGVVLWAQPIIEQVAGDGEGNLDRIATAATREAEEPSVGAARATRLFTTLVAPWPEWDRNGFADAYGPKHPVKDPIAAVDDLQGMPSGAGAALRLIGVSLLLLGAFVVTRRRRDHPWTAGLGVLCVMLIAGLATLTILPITQYGLPVHQVRWLWPVAVIATTWVVAAMAGPSWSRPLTGVVVVLTVALAVISAVPHRQPVGPILDDDAMPVMLALAPQLAAADVEGPLLLEEKQLRVFEPYSISVVLELDRRGVEVVVDDPGLIRQLGEARAATGDERDRVLILQGAAPKLPDGGRVIASVDGLTAAEDRTRLALAEDVADRLRAGDIVLTDRGRLAIELGQLSLSGLDASRPDLGAVAPGLPLAEAAHVGYVIDRKGGSPLAQWTVLERRRDRTTVRVVVAPVER